MIFTIERFQIHGLHNSRDYDIQIRDNRIVMVGVNGLGKTSVVNMLYLILGRQWDRLLEYRFRTLIITINGEAYPLQQVSQEEISVSDVAGKLREHVSRALPASHARSIPSDLIERVAAHMILGNKSEAARELDRYTSIPTSTCRALANSFSMEPHAFDKEMLRRLDSTLKVLTSDCQILYLPTYRRIEKDLSLIVPDFEENPTSVMRRKSLFGPEPRRDFIELVEFGMEDVEGIFKHVQSELVQKARSELNTLAGVYLRDVIREQGHTFDIVTFVELSDATIDRILNRVEEKTLDDTDKAHLRAVIGKLRSASEAPIAQNDQYVAHFFSKLIVVDKALSQREQLIVRFADVCNKYLSGKEMVYNDKESSLYVRLPSGRQLPLRSLSSGEKQIVSLFSHLYLREVGNVYLIIDEPELSLSVAWQQQLLPDILDTEKCKFLAAVTHSPFVFRNKLDPYAEDIATFITEVAQ